MWEAPGFGSLKTWALVPNPQVQAWLKSICCSLPCSALSCAERQKSYKPVNNSVCGIRMEPLRKGVWGRGSYWIAHLALMGSNALRHWFMSCAYPDDGVYTTTSPQAVSAKPMLQYNCVEIIATKHQTEQSTFSSQTHQQVTPLCRGQHHSCAYI